MITVLHFFPKDDKAVAQYVETLCNAMGSRAETYTACALKDFLQKLSDKRPDIVHLHGCWRPANWIAAQRATNLGARIVLSAHGALEPWIVKRHYFTEKLPQLLLYQRRLVKQAMAVIVMGRMEKDCLMRLGYTPRVETVLNSLVTCALTDQQMAAKTCDIYRKVLDSNVWPLMSEQTRLAVKALLKAGITGDSHWLNNEEKAAIHALTTEEQRQVVLYASQEEVTDTVTRGFDVVGCTIPEINPSTVPHYMPTNHKPSVSLKTDGKDLNARITTALKAARKLDWTGKLTIKHLVEIDTLMRSGETSEDKLDETLREKHLLSFARRMMTAMNRLTSLDEGLMPVAMKGGRGAENMIRRITENLEI